MLWRKEAPRLLLSLEGGTCGALDAALSVALINGINVAETDDVREDEISARDELTELFSAILATEGRKDFGTLYG